MSPTRVPVVICRTAILGAAVLAVLTLPGCRRRMAAEYEPGSEVRALGGPAVTTGGAAAGGGVALALLPASAEHAKVALVVESVGDSADAKTVAAAIATHVEGELAAAGYPVMTSAPDVRIRVRAAATVFDKWDEYVVYDGQLITEVLRAKDGRVLGKNEWQARGERKLGKAKALDALRAKLQADAAAWATQALGPDRLGVAMACITVHHTGRVSDDKLYASLFVGVVSRLEGVLSCVADRQESARQQQNVFRVLYVVDQFPEGLLNRLYTIPELRLTPVR